MTAAPSTRRAALRRAALAAGAIATPALLRPAVADAQEEVDEAELEAFLVEAVVLEQIALLAYETAANQLRADRELTRTLERFAGHEQAHASAVRSALDSLGVDEPDPPSAPDNSAAIEDVDELDDERAAELVDLLAELGDIEERDAYLEYLVSLEEAQLELYALEAPEFATEDLLRVGAEIAACQAQHLVVLREALGAAPADALPEIPAAPPGDAEPADGGGD